MRVSKIAQAGSIMELIGAVAAFWIAGQPLLLASMIGFVTPAGTAARNGILKVSHWINLALYEGAPFGPSLVIRGTLERLAPMLMTAQASPSVARLRHLECFHDRARIEWMLFDSALVPQDGLIQPTLGLEFMRPNAERYAA
jgi:HME family heavy-metal exporter